MRAIQLALVIVLLLTGCSRDPNVLKKKYVENGDKYFARGKFKEASILYRKAIGQDGRYGDAFAKLAEAEIRLGRFPQAMRAYHSAVELLPQNTEIPAKLANLYLTIYAAQPNNAPLRAEIVQLRDLLVKRSPNSFDALRLEGYVELMDRQFEKAVEKLRAAERVKPGQPEVAVTLAQSLAALKRIDEAEATAKAALENNKQYSPLYDFLILVALQQQRPQTAEEILRRKVENNPKVESYRLQLAGFYFSQKRMPEMEAALKSIIDNGTDFPNGYKTVGNFYLSTRQYEPARKLFEQGVQARPADKLDFQKRIAETLAMSGKYSESMSLVEGLIKEKADPDLRATRAALVLHTGDRKQLQQAVDDLVAAVQANQKNFVARFNLGRAYIAKGDLEAARLQFQEAIKVRPDFVPARLALAQANLARRDFAAAISAANQILDIDRTNLGARLVRTAALFSSGDVGTARVQLDETLKVHPNSRDAQFQSALLSLAEKKPKDAETQFARLRETAPEDLRGTLGLGEAYIAQGRADQARQLLRNEVQKAPDRDELRLAYANLLFRTADYAGAIGEYQSLIQKRPTAGDLYLRLGIAQGRAQKWDEAQAALRKATDLSPGSPGPWLELGLVMETIGRRSEAVPVYQKVLSLDPDNPVALNNLAFALAEEGRDLDLALKYGERARARLPNNAEVADTLAWIYIKKNLADSALGVLRDVVAKNPDNALFRYHMAMALVQKGDKATAKRELETALRSKPAKPVEGQIRELMGRIG
ncbi:MAG: tetratricopeptide repeat protein [Bryobacteraceae bacterium]|nr:tetratricopeptide repeat protein [Bryobacteraceae bacterium]